MIADDFNKQRAAGCFRRVGLASLFASILAYAAMPLVVISGRPSVKNAVVVTCVASMVIQSCLVISVLFLKAGKYALAGRNRRFCAWMSYAMLFFMPPLGTVLALKNIRFYDAVQEAAEQNSKSDVTTTPDVSIQGDSRELKTVAVIFKVFAYLLLFSFISGYVRFMYYFSKLSESVVGGVWVSCVMSVITFLVVVYSGKLLATASQLLTREVPDETCLRKAVRMASTLYVLFPVGTVLGMYSRFLLKRVTRNVAIALPEDSSRSS